MNPGDLRHPDPLPAAGRAAKVLARLRRIIEEGRFQPGMKLPPERALAAQLGVGRPALREAIKALSILDVLESRRGDGTYVKSKPALHQGWPARIALPPESFTMLELLEVRKMIEPKAAWLAAARATEGHLREIGQAFQKLVEHDRDWQQVAELDLALHSAILRAAQNTALDYVNEMLRPMLLRSRAITARSAPGPSRMYADHQAIVEAIFRGQSHAAEKAMLEHLHSVGLDLIAEIRT